MKRQYSHLQMPKKKVKMAIKFEPKKCKRCLELFQPTRATRLCNNCIGDINVG